MGANLLTLEEALVASFHDAKATYDDPLLDYTLVASFKTNKGLMSVSYWGYKTQYMVGIDDPLMTEGSEKHCRAWIAEQGIELQRFMGYEEGEK